LLALPALKHSSLKSSFFPLETAKALPAADCTTLMEPRPQGSKDEQWE